MQSTASLQEPFTYSFTLLIILGVIIILSVLGFIYKEKIEELIWKNKLPIIKRKYLTKLDELLDNVNKNNINNRDAYISLSVIGRGFIKSVTKIDVLTISLNEAKNMDIPNLASLMEECYPPEFAKKSKGNVISSIDNVRRIIYEWN